MLQNPVDARMMLKPQVQSISHQASGCMQAAEDMEAKFQDWLFNACELYAACVKHNGDAAEVAQASRVCTAAEQARLDRTQDAAKITRAVTDLLNDRVVASTHAFKLAPDVLPTG